MESLKGIQTWRDNKESLTTLLDGAERYSTMCEGQLSCFHASKQNREMSFII